MSNTPLQNWLDRPMTVAERDQIAAAAKANAIIHPWNCLCAPCCGRRRAVCDGNAPNQTRLLSDNETQGVRLADNLVTLLLILLAGLSTLGWVICKVFEALDRSVSL